MYSTMLVLLFILVNIVGDYIATYFRLPLWLDCVGTIAAAIHFGAVISIVVSGASSIFMGIMGSQHFWYIPTGFAVALIVGLIYPKSEKKEQLGVVTLALVAGLVSSFINTPIDVSFCGGYTLNLWGDALKAMLDTYVNASKFSTLVAELFINLPDRVLSILLAQLLIGGCGRFRKYYIQKKNKSRAEKKTVSMILIIALAGSLIGGITADASDLYVEYEETYIGENEGLTTADANTVVQTDDGYIWAGTYSGLFRYDGVSFEEIQFDENIRTVKDIYVDSRHRMWIGSNESGLVRYNFDTNEVKRFSTDEGMPSDTIRKITEDKNGNIYIATDRELTRISADDNVKSYYEWPDIVGVDSLAPMDDGGMMGVTRSGILFIIKDDILTYTGSSSDEDYQYVCVCVNGDDVIVGTSETTVEHFVLGDGELEYKDEISGFDMCYFNDIVYDPGYDLYFCCCDSSHGYLDLNIRKLFTFDGNMSDGHFGDVCVDSQGNIWFASSLYGLVKYSYTPFVNILRNAGMPGYVVNALYKDDHLMYVGTNDGLKIIDLADNHEVFSKLEEWVAGARVRNIFKDSKGTLWISEYGMDGLIYCMADGTIGTIDFSAVGIESPSCRFATELSDGQIVVSVREVGLVFIKDNEIVSVIGAGDGMANTTILSCYEREDGILMAASDGDGIYLIKDERIVGHVSKSEGLASGVVMRIVPCESGFIYVTSNALYYDDGETIRLLENFPFYNNFDVIISDDNVAWITSSGGLWAVSLDQLLADGDYNCTLLDKDWGLTTTFNSNSWNLLDGNILYLCCTDGVRAIDINSYNKANDDYQLKLKLVETTGGNFENFGDSLVIPAVTGRITFHVAVNNFTLTNPLIHYYLEGTGDDGITCYQDEITPLAFTNLPYGKYKFHIEVIDDITGEVLRSEVISVVKEAQMYEKPYFSIYLLFVNSLMLMYFFWLFIAMRSNAKRIRNLRREIHTDPMTGLLNKAGSHKMMGEACDKETGIFLMIDLDSFKLVNDLYGHDMGDRILIRFAELIKEAINEDDYAGRLGGDEFVAFLRDTMSEDDVEKVCRHLNQGIVKSAKEYMGEGMNIPLGASIGAAKVPADGRGIEKVFRYADKALYNVKQNGKHGYAFYTKGDNKDKAREKNDDNDLKKIKQIIGERNEGKGAFEVNFDRMQVLYKFLNRADKSNNSTTGFYRITLSAKDGGEVPDETMELFDDILVRSLGKTDVVSEFSGSFFVLKAGGDNKELPDKIRGLLESEGLADKYDMNIEADTVG